MRTKSIQRNVSLWCFLRPASICWRIGITGARSVSKTVIDSISLIRDEWMGTCYYDTLWTSIWQMCCDSFRTLLIPEQLSLFTAEKKSYDIHTVERFRTKRSTY